METYVPIDTFTDPVTAPGADVAALQEYLDREADILDLLDEQGPNGRWLVGMRDNTRPIPPNDVPPAGGGDSTLTQEVKDALSRGRMHWAGFETAESRTSQVGFQAVLAPDTLLVVPGTRASMHKNVHPASHQCIDKYQARWVGKDHDPLLGELEEQLDKFTNFREGDAEIPSEWTKVEALWRRFPQGSVSVINMNPRYAVRYKSLSAGGPDRIASPATLQAHEKLHGVHAVTGALASERHRKMIPDRSAYGDSLMARLNRGLRVVGFDDSLYEYGSEGEDEETFTGSREESRQAALRAIEGSKKLKLPDGTEGPLTWRAIYGAHRVRSIMWKLHSELLRLKATAHWEATFGRKGDPEGLQTLRQFEHQADVLRKAATTCEGELSTESALRGAVRHTYWQPASGPPLAADTGDVGELLLHEEIQVSELQYEHLCPPKGTYGRKTISGNRVVDIFANYGPPHGIPLAPTGPEKDSSIAPDEIEGDCTLLQPVDVQRRINPNDPNLSDDVKGHLDIWRPAWEAVGRDSGLAAREVTVTGREMTGLPGGRGVWSKAGNVVPGTSVLMKGELGAATGMVNRELTVGGQGKEARLQEFRAKFGPGGEGLSAEMTLAVLTAPGLLEDAFRKGTPPLRRAADVLALNPRWFKPATALYVANDIVHGDFKAAGEKVVELGAWLSAFAMLDLMGAGPVGWGLAALYAVLQERQRELAEIAEEKKTEDAVSTWVKAEIKADLAKAPKTLWAQAFGDMATALGGEALRLESAAAHDAQVTIATIDNLAALVLQKGAGFADLDKAWWDKLDQEIQAAEWTEDRKTLYNDWLYGTPGTAPDATRRRVFCHLSVCLYRQLRDMAGSGLQTLLDGLDTSPTELPVDHRGDTPRDGLEFCYRDQLETIEHLAETVTSIADSKALTNSVPNIATWLQTAHADFKRGARRMSEIAKHAAYNPQVPESGTFAYSQHAKYGKFIYADLFVYQPLNPSAVDSLSTGRGKAEERAKRRQGPDFRLPAGFERDWSVLSVGDDPIKKVDAFIPGLAYLDEYYAFSRDPGGSSGFYRGFYSRKIGNFAPVWGEKPSFVEEDGKIIAAASFTSSASALGGLLGSMRYVFMDSPPRYRRAIVLGASIMAPKRDEQSLDGKYFSGLRKHGYREISLSSVDAVMPDPVNTRFWFFEGNKYVLAQMGNRPEDCQRLAAGRITADSWPALFGKSPDGIDDDFDRIDGVIRVPGTFDYYVFKGKNSRLITIPLTGALGGSSVLVRGPYRSSGFPVDVIVDLQENPLQQFAVFGGDQARVWGFQGMQNRRVLLQGTTDVDEVNWPSLVIGSQSFYVVDAVMPADTGPNQYYVFSGTRYRRIEIGNPSPLEGSQEILAYWPSLQHGDSPNFTSVDAVLPVPGVVKEFYVFSGEWFRRIRLAGTENILVAGPGKINQGLLWPELAHAGFTRVDAFLPVPEKSQTYHVFSGSKTLEVGYEPDTTADLLGLHCWSLQEGLLAAIAKTGILDRKVYSDAHPAGLVALKDYVKSSWDGTGRDVVEDIRGALKRLWDPSTWNFRNTDFGKLNGDIDGGKIKFELRKFFPQSVRTALLAPSVGGELPFQLAKDATDVINTTGDDNKYSLRGERARAAVGRLETALEDWQAAVKDFLDAGAAADRYYGDAGEEKWDDAAWATARVQEWSDFHTKLGAAWAYVEKADGGLGPGIYAAAERLADPDAGAFATAVGTQMQDALRRIYRQFEDIRAKNPGSGL
ncbi:hypothetical protein [Streptomyces sp. x-19]|uniref:hypothetical protein n=1 Tax=Streptomyces sp. x-19 TaxID=2789280 RepID=UPI00397EAF0E